MLADHLRPISPLSTGLSPKIPLCANRIRAHIPAVIGTEAPAFSEGRQRLEGQDGTEGPISAGRRWMRGPKQSSPRAVMRRDPKSGPVGKRRRKSRSAFARAVSPPGKPSRAKQANPRRAVEVQGAERPSGLKRSSLGKQAILRDGATNEEVRIPRIRPDRKRRLSW